MFPQFQLTNLQEITRCQMISTLDACVKINVRRVIIRRTRITNLQISSPTYTSYEYYFLLYLTSLFVYTILLAM